MKKGLLTFLILFISIVSANAAKSTGMPHAFVQPDGTTLMVRLLGDENFSWYQTTDGVLLKQIGKFFYIAKTMEDGTLASTGIIAHNLDSRNETEATAAKAQNSALFFVENPNKMKAQHKAISGYPSKRFCPHHGNIRIPVIMIEFAKTDSDDVKFSFPKDTVLDYYFNGTGTNVYNSKSETKYDGYSSVAQYFKDASFNDLNMTFDLYGPYTTKYGHDYYGNHDGDNYSQGTHDDDLIEEAIDMADANIDFSLYDSNNDGNVDMVYVLYAGTGTNISGDQNDFWPKCYYNASYSTKEGKTINVIGAANELLLTAAENDGTPMRAGIGVTCHEMTHGMGLPDLYWTLSRVPKDSQGYVDYNNCGPEDWDLMDGGENLYSGIWPCQFAAWERDAMGWIEAEELTEPTDVTIYPLNKEGGKAYKVVNPDNNYEYYVIENYMYDEWNTYVRARYGSGLMITHINATSSGLAMSPNNTYGKPNVTLVPADGFILASYSAGETIQYKGEVVKMPEADEVDADGYYTYNWINNYFKPDAYGDPYIGSKYTGDPITSVAAYKNYTQNADKEDMVVKYPITDITRNDDGSISFKFMGGTPSAISNITVDDSSSKNAPIYTTDGRLVGNDRNALPHGLYIQNGHKFIK